jgi:hypothetical protein
VTEKEFTNLKDAVSAEHRRIRIVKCEQRYGISLVVPSLSERKSSGLPAPLPTEPVDFNMDQDDLDWFKIAKKVSASSTRKRDAQDCKIIWMADRNTVANREEWTDTELERLTEIVNNLPKQNKIDWVDVANKLGVMTRSFSYIMHADCAPDKSTTVRLFSQILEETDPDVDG